MYFEDLATHGLPELPTTHPYFWIETALNATLPEKEVHDAEHGSQLIKWGCDPKHTHILGLREDVEGVRFFDRMHHLMLHLRYWKEENILMEYVEKFEGQSGKNLDDLTIPSQS